MKKPFLFVAALLFFASAVTAQKWKDLTDEQKMSKLEDFRADNQKYLKETIGLSQDKLDDVDNVNVCFLSTLDRIDRYGKSDADKEKYAKAAVASRSAQLDAIMGPENRKKFQDYVSGKLKKAGVIK